MSKNIELIQSALEGFPGCRVLHVTENAEYSSAVWCSLENLQAVASLASILLPLNQKAQAALVVVSIDAGQSPIFAVMSSEDADTNSEIAFAIQAHTLEQSARTTFERCSPASELVM